MEKILGYTRGILVLSAWGRTGVRNNCHKPLNTSFEKQISTGTQVSRDSFLSVSLNWMDKATKPPRT